MLNFRIDLANYLNKLCSKLTYLKRQNWRSKPELSSKQESEFCNLHSVLVTSMLFSQNRFLRDFRTNVPCFWEIPTPTHSQTFFFKVYTIQVGSKKAF